MSTTNLFVELVVIGVGATTALGFVLLTVLGWTWAPWGRVLSLEAAVPALSVVYVLGIVTDRLSDLAFRPINRRLQRKYFPTSDAYHKAKNAVYASEARRDLQEYGRSRLRICRAWAVVWLVLAVAAPIFVTTRALVPIDPTRLCIALSLTCTLQSIACLYSWWAITENNFKQLKFDSTR